MSVLIESINRVKANRTPVAEAVGLYVVLTQASIGGRKLSDDEATILGYLDAIFNPLREVWR